MLHPDCTNAVGLPMTVRTVYVISPEKILKLSLTYPASTGRNFDEVGRLFFVFVFVFCSSRGAERANPQHGFALRVPKRFTNHGHFLK